MPRISGLSCFFLIALRLVIGWHFAVEGLWKIRTHQIGKTSTNTPWTSEGFFREVYGPYADWYRQHLGISDEWKIAMFRNENPKLGFPARSDWWGYFFSSRDGFAKHYQLTEEQTAACRTVLERHLLLLDNWLEGDAGAAPIVKMPVVWGTADVPLTVKARIVEYDAKQREIQEIQASEQTNFNKDVDRARLRTLKTEAARILNDIVTEYDVRTKAMKKDVEEAAKLTPEQLKLGPVPEPPKPARLIDKLDTLTMWMQAVLGGFLLIGLWTRLSSLVLAGFLAQVVLLAPALPWVSPPPGTVGHYLYVDMHAIEFVALMALATIPTGRWFGLDALFCRARGKTRGQISQSR
jgi:uncharacterized membrane protein YphA (DoxX/SURF4 family)